LKLTTDRHEASRGKNGCKYFRVSFTTELDPCPIRWCK